LLDISGLNLAILDFCIYNTLGIGILKTFKITRNWCSEFEWSNHLNSVQLVWTALCRLITGPVIEWWKENVGRKIYFS
jgi:hypothetical protein